MNTAMGFSRNARPYHISYSNTESTALKTISQCEKSISSFSRLAYEYANIVTEDGAPPIEEIAGKFCRNWNFSQFFKNGSGSLRNYGS